MRLDFVPFSSLRYNPSINARGSTPNDVSELAATIAAFDPDIAKHWQPDKDFLARLPRPLLEKELKAAGVAGVSDKLKKGELVNLMLKHLVPKGWLPKELRMPRYKGPGAEALATPKRDSAKAGKRAGKAVKFKRAA